MAKIADRVIANFPYFPILTITIGRKENAANIYLGIEENEPERVGITITMAANSQ